MPDHFSLESILNFAARSGVRRDYYPTIIKMYNLGEERYHNTHKPIGPEEHDAAKQDRAARSWGHMAAKRCIDEYLVKFNLQQDEVEADD